jgi:hypothetical protein
MFRESIPLPIVRGRSKLPFEEKKTPERTFFFAFKKFPMPKSDDMPNALLL